MSAGFFIDLLLTNTRYDPEDLVTHRFPLEKVSDAFSVMAEGKCGKVAVVFDEEMR